MKILETEFFTKNTYVEITKSSNNVHANLDIEYAKKYVFKYIQNLNICTKNELLRFYYLTNTILEIFDEEVSCAGLATLIYQCDISLKRLYFSIDSTTKENIPSYYIEDIIKEKTHCFDIEVTNETTCSIKIELEMKVFNSDLPEINDKVIADFNNLLN